MEQVLRTNLKTSLVPYLKIREAFQIGQKKLFFEKSPKNITTPYSIPTKCLASK